LACAQTALKSKPPLFGGFPRASRLDAASANSSSQGFRRAGGRAFPRGPEGSGDRQSLALSHWVRARGHGSSGGLSTGDHPSKPFPMFALGSRVAMRPAGIVFHPRKGGGTLSFGGFHARVLDVFLLFSIKSGPKRVDTVRCITASNASLCENDIPRMPLTGENPHPRGRRYSQSWSSDSP